MFLWTNFIWPCDLTLDLLTLAVSDELIRPTHIPIFSILRLSVPEWLVTQMWSHYHHMERSLRMRRVTWPITGGKNSPHFLNPWPQFAYSLCHFQGATTKITPCYRRKIAFSPLWRLQSSLRMCSIMWPVHRGPPKPHVTISWPRIVYSLYNFYGATTTIKRFSAVKTLCPVKTGPHNVGFSEIRV